MTCLASGFLGRRMMLAELRRSKPYEFIMKRALIAATTLDLMIPSMI